jgi:cation diffusion facilitator CzcD-associated flavoprotein CzcO
MSAVPHHEVIIIGTGFSGLATAIKLAELNEDFIILERADDVGGVWRENDYPGAACDIPSHLYSLRTDLNPTWSRSFSAQPEIHQYLRTVADKHGLRDRIKFGSEVERADWDETAQRWLIRTVKGDLTASKLVAATGHLSDPAIPQIPGVEAFDGPTFHSSTWQHDLDLAGKRVAVIGTGASAIQFVPRVAQIADHVTVFQRTPAWILPRGDRPIRSLEKQLFRKIPAVQHLARRAIFLTRELLVIPMLHPRLSGVLERAALKHLRESVSDPEVRAKLTPNYRIGCKRILISDDYLPALSRPNVDLVTERIESVDEDGAIRTGAGTRYDCDVIIYGTGFKTTDLPIAHRIRGRDGSTLAEAWAGSPVAHQCTTVSGFPNLFLITGPSTGTGHTSATVMLETQAAHLARILTYMKSRSLHTVEPSREAQERFAARIDRRSAGTVWSDGGCDSWYLDSTGRNSTIWPSFATAFVRELRRFEASDFEWHPDHEVAPHATETPARTL